MKKIGTIILGGTGYGAGELLRLFLAHNEIEPVAIVSSSAAGETIDTAHPHLRNLYQNKFVAQAPFEKLLEYQHAVVFAALPHGASGEAVAKLPASQSAEKIKFIDLSGDFRLQDAALHQKFYADSPLRDEIRNQFVYGLTELNRDKIRNARFIANPGCFATCCALAVAPLLQKNWTNNVIFDAKSGSSGAGRSLNATFHHPKRHASFAAYKVLSHRHEPEIQQTLSALSNAEVETAFVPHLIPNSRGIYVTAYATLNKSVSTEELKAYFAEFYRDCQFVRICNEPPELDNVVGSNFCDISITVRGKQVVCNSTLDNLVKGMAGQAIQNLNVMCGLNETTGLMQAPLSLI